MSSLIENPMKAALARGDVLIGTWIVMARNPAIVALLHAAGCDFVRVDMEHSSIPLEVVANMALVARGVGCGFAVRPPVANREWITRLLDAGVTGLHLPQIDTPEIARQALEAAYYSPLGMRGTNSLGPHNGFNPSISMQALNAQMHITIMLESPQSFDNIDAILALPGIDAVTLGPSDLAQELGLSGRPEQAATISAYREKLYAAAARHGRQIAMLARDVEAAKTFIAQGAQIVTIGSEAAILRQGVREIADQLSDARKAR